MGLKPIGGLKPTGGLKHTGGLKLLGWGGGGGVGVSKLLVGASNLLGNHQNWGPEPVGCRFLKNHFELTGLEAKLT